MANITAADVKKLRELTGSGMMDCKNALAESGGDLAKAVELLRIKGAKDVTKRAERTVANGLVAAGADAAGGTMVELSCETDFVAKSADFQALAARILDVAAASRPADLDELAAARLDDAALDGGTVGEAVEGLSARIGEKLQLRRTAHLDGPVALYLHRRATDLPPAIGVLVGYTGAGAGAAETARAVAMHIAAARPRYITRDAIPAEVVAEARRSAEDMARAEGKPAAVIAKIVDGRLAKFFKDVVLLEQAAVQDLEQTVATVLDEAGVTVTGFARFEVGQG